MKTILKRISAGTLAAVFLATFAIPRTKAIVAEGFDIVAAANAVVATHLTSLGGDLAIAEGGSSALAASTESLFMQAGAAGAFGAGVTGAAAMSTLVTGLNAFAGGFMLGYEGYQVVTQFVEWLKANKLISADEANTIYQTGGSFKYLTNGKPVINSDRYPINTDLYYYGRIYSTQAGSSWKLDIEESKTSAGKQIYKIRCTAITADNKIVVESNEAANPQYTPTEGYYIYLATSSQLNITTWYNYNSTVRVPRLPDSSNPNPFLNVFEADASYQGEKREVTFIPPATWTPPAPKPGQSVLYKPFPNAPDKGLEDIIADVPEAIASSNFKPAATTVIETPTPEPPSTPEVPPTVNPNPDVEAPEDVTPYTVKIGEVFPFCIPFDLYHMVTMFSAEPKAPNGKWEFYLPWEKQDAHPQLYKVEWDLEKFDDLAELCRKLELILFCVGLAVITSRLIKW